MQRIENTPHAELPPLLTQHGNAASFSILLHEEMPPFSEDSSSYAAVMPREMLPARCLHGQICQRTIGPDMEGLPECPSCPSPCNMVGAEHHSSKQNAPLRAMVAERAPPFPGETHARPREILLMRGYKMMQRLGFLCLPAEEGSPRAEGNPRNGYQASLEDDECGSSLTSL
eukprot:593590-Rhodomonas_salina.3